MNRGAKQAKRLWLAWKIFETALFPQLTQTLTRNKSDNVSVFEVLRKGLQDLEDMCDVIEEKFVASRDEFKISHPDGGPAER